MPQANDGSERTVDGEEARAVLRRSVTFRAMHAYRRTDWDEARNRTAFGELTEPHVHDYRVTFWIEGAMAPVTGFVAPLDELDAAIEALVAPLREADLNAVLPEVRRGEILPSCEALAHWFFRSLGERLSGGLRLVAVDLDESEGLGARVTG